MVAQRDAWALGSYRRLDLLDVPAFRDPALAAAANPLRVTRAADLRLLPTDLPRAVQPLTDWVRGDSSAASGLSNVDKLSLLLRYVAAPLRFEPLNSYATHRGVPSPRCLYPLRYVLEQNRDGTRRSYAYHPDFHAVEPISSPGQALPGEAELTLVVVARLWSVADIYGDFAPFATTLEAGMAYAQIACVAALLGWSLPHQGDRRIARRQAGALELPLLAVPLPGAEPDLEALPRRRIAVADIAPREDLGRFPALPGLAACFDEGEPAPRGAAARTGTSPAEIGNGDGHTGTDVLDVLRTRNAGNDVAGLAPRFEASPSGLFSPLLGRFKAISSRRPKLAGESVLEVRLAWLADGGPEPGLYGLDGRRSSRGAAGAAFRQVLEDALPHPGFLYNVKAFVGSLLICADPQAAMAALGPAALRETHLAAGAVAQDFSLAAASLGLFARPVRMFRETVIESGYGLEGQLTYQVLCGSNRRANPYWEML